MAIEIRDFSSIICGFTIKVKVTKGEMFVPPSNLIKQYQHDMQLLCIYW